MSNFKKSGLKTLKKPELWLGCSKNRFKDRKKRDDNFSIFFLDKGGTFGIKKNYHPGFFHFYIIILLFIFIYKYLFKKYI